LIRRDQHHGWTTATSGSVGEGVARPVPSNVVGQGVLRKTRATAFMIVRDSESRCEKSSIIPDVPAG